VKVKFPYPFVGVGGISTSISGLRGVIAGEVSRAGRSEAAETGVGSGEVKFVEFMESEVFGGCEWADAMAGAMEGAIRETRVGGEADETGVFGSDTLRSLIGLYTCGRELRRACALRGECEFSDDWDAMAEMTCERV
jgi:hypothetical protein